jgi:F-type H+-transporting ATPase subunit epsilon
MTNTIQVEIVSAERSLYSGAARMVVAPGASGELGILPRHAPLLTLIRPGIVAVTTAAGEEEFIYVSGGILEVQPDQVTVLADVAERGEDLDSARAEEARRAAEEKLRAGTTGMDYAAAQAELAQAIAQIQAIRRLRGRK